MQNHARKLTKNVTKGHPGQILHEETVSLAAYRLPEGLGIVRIELLEPRLDRVRRLVHLVDVTLQRTTCMKVCRPQVLHTSAGLGPTLIVHAP